MAPPLESLVREEIEDLHAFFVGWFSGTLEQSVFDSAFMARMDPELVLIPPAGNVLELDELEAGLRKGHGANPDFRIAIQNVRVLRSWDHHVLAIYEEWQRGARQSTPSNNGRVATVLFRRSERLTWLHVHETWLPPEVMAAGPYDF